MDKRTLYEVGNTGAHKVVEVEWDCAIRDNFASVSEEVFLST